MINAPRSIKWSLKDDAILLVHHWHDALNTCRTRWHVKGHSPSEAAARLQELKTCLSPCVYDLWPDASAIERSALRPMLALLTSAAGRQQLISEMDAAQAAEDVGFCNADAAPWIDELQQFHDGDDVAALVMALDDLPRRHEGSFTRNDDLELICKVQRVHHSEGQELQKDITVGDHASDDGCQHRVQALRSKLSECLAHEFLPKYGSSSVFAAELDRRVSAAMLGASRTPGRGSSNAAQKLALRALRKELRAEPNGQRKAADLPHAIRRAYRHHPQLNAAQPALLCNPELPPLTLHYDSDVILPQLTADGVPMPVAQRQPLPYSAYVQPLHGVGLQAAARIPSEWLLRLDSSRFILREQLHSEYSVADVTRHTRVSQLNTDIQAFVRCRTGCRATNPALVHESCDVDGSVRYALVDANATVEDANLFNIAHQLLVSSLTVIELQHHRYQLQQAIRGLLAAAERTMCAIDEQMLRISTLPQLQTLHNKLSVPSPPAATSCACLPPSVPPTVLPSSPTPTATRTCVRTSIPLQQPTPHTPESPPVQPPERDALQQLLHAASQGAGNPRPHAPEHNAMANNLCAAPHAHHVDTRLPTDEASYRKVRRMLEAVDEQPHCVCSNCGFTDLRDKMHVISVRCAAASDLRAWRVYQPALEALASELSVNVNEVFLCEPVPVSCPPRCRVFSCATCRAEAKRDVAQYDMFDGHADTAESYCSIGLGEPLPTALQSLSMEGRLSLSLIKV